eukprot:scaffold7755_cov149-Chaetoceros_neogracile.AAC.2
MPCVKACGTTPSTNANLTISSTFSQMVTASGSGISSGSSGLALKCQSFRSSAVIPVAHCI